MPADDFSVAASAKLTSGPVTTRTPTGTGVGSSASPLAVCIYALCAGALVASTYAAVEILVSGPLAVGFDQSIGSWYTRAVFTYALVYALLGAALGLAAGAVLVLVGRGREHALPMLAALLFLAFVANAFAFGDRTVALLFLALLGPLAAWLLLGLRSVAADPVRAVVGSPWPAALLTLVPLGLSEGIAIRVRNLLILASVVAVAGIVAMLAHRARGQARPVGMRALKPHAVATGSVLLGCFAVLSLLSMEPVSAQRPGRPSVRPNIVLMTLDTTRADRLSLYGYPHRTTPRLEAFASRATLYRHAYANGDMTLSSHGSLFTGLYPTLHGAHLDHDQRSAVAASVPTLGELLKNARYRTYASVANNTFLDPAYGFERGFDDWDVVRPLAVVSPDRGTYLLRKGLYKITLPWLWTEALRLFVPAGEIASRGETLITDAEAEPFFLFLNFMETHRPWMSSGSFRARFPDYEQTFDELEVRSFARDVVAGRREVSEDEKERMGAAYDGSIAYLDDAVGRLLERFAREPWFDNSLVIVTADHGEFLGERNMLDHGNGVDAMLTSIPLIVKYPGQTAGHVVESPVSQVDVFATIAAAARLKVPGPRAGVDLAAGDPGQERSIIIESFAPSNFAVNPKVLDRMERALVKGRWKLIASTAGRRALYDMVSDPLESTDVSSTHPEIARELEQQLQAWAASAERQRPAKTEDKGDADLLQRLKALGYVQ
jgi:arylsulfatase A-like enzyme